MIHHMNDRCEAEVVPLRLIVIPWPVPPAVTPSVSPAITLVVTPFRHSTLTPLLEGDRSLMAVSAWNDNGLSQFVRDPAQLYR
jgi:hypothetical protein